MSFLTGWHSRLSNRSGDKLGDAPKRESTITFLRTKRLKRGARRGRARRRARAGRRAVTSAACPRWSSRVVQGGDERVDLAADLGLVEEAVDELRI